MKNTIQLLLMLFLAYSINAQVIYSDIAYKNTSLDFITDAASAAMGESFVAALSKEKSFFENPAALAGKNNFSVFYNHRYNGWHYMIKDAKYFSAGIAVPTKHGSFGFSFNQYTSGEYNAGTAGAKVEDKNNTLIFSYSNNLSDNLTAGINAKIFNHNYNSSGSYKYEIKSNNAVLFDLGIVYNFPYLIDAEEMRSDLSLGIALQNFGTEYKEEHKYLFNETTKPRLPRYLRAGFAYESNLILGRLTRFEIDLLVTGEYKSLINPAEQEKHDVDYWSGGIEATFFKIVSLRAGFLNSPGYSILFDRKEFNWRYGAGLKIPMAMMALKNPIIIKFDYAIIPINSSEFTVISPDGSPRIEKTKNHLYSFSVTLSYAVK